MSGGDDMRVTIVIAAHNEGDRLRRTVESCLETIGTLDHEIVLADDASTDGSVDVVAKSFPMVRVIRNEQRRGAAPTKALGAQHALGETLVFLDAHTKPEYGALQGLVEDVEELGDKAIITPAIAALDPHRWTNDLFQVGHGYYLDMGSFECGWKDLAELRPVREGRKHFYASPALIGCALALSRSLYNRLWGFDSRMRAWGVEDLDLGLKCWLMGHRILHDPDAVIGHAFREGFDTYSVPMEYLVVNELRMARKNFTHAVWSEWVDRCRQRYPGPLRDHPEGFWAAAWQLYEADRPSAEQERSYLHARRARDEFWYAENFGLTWPRLVSAAGLPPAFEALASPSGRPSPSPHPSPSPAPRGITVVNMTPKALSGEANQDSEPWLAVDPANPKNIVATAFTPNPAGSGNAPIYVSNNGGNSWLLNAIVPSAGITGDITVGFSGTTNRLYAGIIVVPVVDTTPRVRVLRTATFLGPGVMTTLWDQQGKGLDQPRVSATTVSGGKDRLFVGVNDFNAGAQTATVLVSQDAGAATPAFTTVRVESRSTGTAGQDGPTVMPALAADGKTVYAAFFHWRSVDASNNVTADVVVVRDDNGATGPHPFQALADTDGHFGKRVVEGIVVNLGLNLGPQPERVGSDLALAVDPTNKSLLYLAYADIQPSGYMLHIRRSADSGATWSATDLLTLTNATNPSLAVNSAGKVGFLYQQLTGTGSAQRWETHLQRLTFGGTWVDLLLATVPADAPVFAFDPYLGDYVKLQPVGRDFYGVFCANNTPDKANFPHGIIYQRNANFTTHTLLGFDGVTPVPVSIDPFFFKVPD